MGRIKFKEFHWLLWGLFVATSSDFARADANPEISPFQPPIDPRPRLSTTQQQQILNDVQQHQRRFNFAKYRVDPLKQQFQQPQQQQQPQPQPQQSDRSFFQTAQSQYQFPRQNFAPTGLNPFSAFQTDLPIINFRNAPDDLNFFNDPTATLQLQSYYEKQRELELLRKQREQLILEQQELRRQQELLRLQQLRALTSTTPKPTTTTTTTTTTTQQPAITQSPALLASPSSRRITPAESEIFLKAIANHQRKFITTTSRPVTPKAETTTHRPRQDRVQEDQLTQDIPRELLSLIQAQNPQLLGGGKNKPQIKIIYQTEKPATQRATLKTKSLEKDLLLKQLKLALAENSEAEIEKNVTTRDLVLPNGKKLQVIQASNGLSSIIPNEGSSQFQTVTQALDTKTASTTSIPTTAKSASTILEELAKGVLPPGADFEVLKHKDDGKLEEVGKVPIQNSEKKVTFVVLEEQSDGSYKVQGVKGNNEKDNSSDVQTIVEKIKNGELKLPPSSKSPLSDDKTSSGKVTKPTTSTTTTTTTPSPTTIEPTTYRPSTTAEPTTVKPTTIRPTTIRPSTNIKTTTTKYTEIPNVTTYHNNELTRDYSPYAAVTSNSVISTDNYVTSASTPSANIYNSISSFIPSSQRPTTAANYRLGSSPIVIAQKNHFIPTMAPVNEIITTPSPSFGSHSSSYVHFSTNLGNPATTVTPRYTTSTIGSINNVASENLIIDDFHQGRNTVSFDNSINQFNNGDTIANLLKREGLFAMAKYLRQSGLDKVLNDTGPYTMFIPTDKAFRALLVQLGGPEKAEQKFKENPRLLSGLLLHHVIPGDFRTESLQEEMTGVSLAGTQLRVNVYDMHDHEWNDVKVTTINGARIAPNKRDIEIPQGIAHAVDRVMFPLPVGDLMQTLAADREQRFGIFLRILQAAGLEDTLTGTKTYTIFAPTDAAFAATAAQTGQPVWSETDGPEVAKTIASKHIMPTTLYSAGMRYYHQKDTLRPQFTLRIQKNGGRVRVNEAQVVTPNIPATNGVIQAIDGVLQ